MQIIEVQKIWSTRPAIIAIGEIKEAKVYHIPFISGDFNGIDFEMKDGEKFYISDHICESGIGGICCDVAEVERIRQVLVQERIIREDT